MSVSIPATALYNRLGGRQAIERIMDDVLAKHLANPVIAPRFTHADYDRLRGHAIDFFCVGCGGPEQYSGRDMRTTHAGMNISEQEFVAVLDDILDVLDKHGVGLQERQELLAILYSLKNDVVRL